MGSAAGTHASAGACLDGLDGPQLLAVAGEALRRLSIDPLSNAISDAELAASVTGLQRLETRVHAEKLRRIGELDARKAYRVKAMSTADWLAPHLDDHVAACGPGKTAGQLRGSIDELHHRDSPEVLAERERRAHARRHAWIERGGPDGQMRFGGQLGRVAGAHLAAAVDALARPHNATTNAPPGNAAPMPSPPWPNRPLTAVSCPRSPPNAPT